MRDVAQLLAAAILVLGLGWFVYDWQFGPAGASRLSIQELAGDVSVDLPGGPVAPAIGAELTGEERLVTGGGSSRVVLSLGQSSRVTVEADSTVQVLGSDDDGVKLALEDGRVRANVRPEDGQLGVVAGEREVSARDAAFAIGLDPDGTTEVQVGSGEVTLTGFEGAELASGGQRVVASDGGVSLEAIPTSLLLKVEWPDERTRKERVALRGVTDPGAEVRVDTATGPIEAKADASGAFEVVLILDEGDNAVEVVATSVLGDRTAASWRITRDSQGPTGVFEVRY